MATASFSGNSSLDLAAINDILTTYYIPRMFEQIKVETPSYEFFKDQSAGIDWGPGNTATFYTRKKAKRAVVGGNMGRLPKGGTPSWTKHEFEYPVFRVLMSFLWDARLKGSHERYIKSMIEDSIRDAKQEYTRRFNTYLYGGSRDKVASAHSAALFHDSATDVYGKTCIVGLLQEASVDASAEIKVKHPWTDGGGAHLPYGGQWLQAGDYVMVVGNVLANADDQYVHHKIKTVDRSTYSSGYATITLENNMGDVFPVGSPIYFSSPETLADVQTRSGGVGGATFSDTSWELSDYASEFLGLANFLEDNSVFGTTRQSAGGTDEYWDSVIHTGANAGGAAGTAQALTYERLDALLLESSELFFTRPNMAMMQSGMFHEFLALAEANHAFFNQQTLQPGHQPGINKNYTTVKATMGAGDLNILVDPYCPHETIICCNTDDMGYATLQGLSEAGEDGKFLRHIAGDYDEWHGWLRWAGQFVTYSPANVSCLKDITQSIVAL